MFLLYMPMGAQGDLIAHNKFSNYFVSLTDSRDVQKFLEGKEFFMELFETVVMNGGHDMKIDFIQMAHLFDAKDVPELVRISLLRTFIRAYSSFIEQVAPKGWKTATFLQYIEETVGAELVDI